MRCVVAPPILPFDSVTSAAATLGHAASATIEVVRTIIARARRAEVCIASANLQQNPVEVTPPQGVAHKRGHGARSVRADAGTRTPDPLLTMEVLYRLSYVGVRRHPVGISAGPKPSAD